MAGMNSPSFREKGRQVKKSFNPNLPEGPDNQRDQQPSDDELIGMINQQNQDDMDSSPAPSSSPAPAASAAPSPLRKMQMPKKKKPQDEDVW